MPARAGPVPKLTHQRQVLALVVGVALVVVARQLPPATLLLLALALTGAAGPGGRLRGWLAAALLVTAVVTARQAGAAVIAGTALIALLVLKLGEARSDTELLLVAVLLPLPLLLLVPGTPMGLFSIAVALGACALILNPQRPVSRATLAILGLALLIGAAGAWLPRRARVLARGGAGVVPEASIVLGGATTWPDGQRVAFWARFRGARPAPNARYWRLLVLDATDGQRWWASRHSRVSARRRGPAAYRYRIWRAAGPWPALVTLDPPLSANGIGIGGNGVAGGAERHYRAHSGGLLTAAPTVEDRSVPPATPAVRALAARLAQASGGGAGAYAQTVLAWLGRHKFRYTRHPQLGPGDPVANFLLRARAGYCQDFAASFAVLMRLQGVPARVVVGYYGGRYQRRSQSVVVRAREAHAWTEIWSRGAWLRVDPTTMARPGMARTLRHWRRALARFARRWGWAGALWLLAAATLGLAAARHARDPYAGLYRALAARGWRRGPGEGHRSFAQRLARERPEAATALETAANLYLLQRYAPTHRPRSLLEPVRRVRQALRRAHPTNVG